jgi:hypothetical protein
MRSCIGYLLPPKPIFRLEWSNFDLLYRRIGFPLTIILLVKMQKI